MCIRDRLIDGAGKSRIFDDSNGFAGMKLHLLPASRRLHPAVQGSVEQSVALDVDFIPVEVCIKTERQRPCESLQTSLFRELQELLDSARLDHGK